MSDVVLVAHVVAGGAGLVTGALVGLVRGAPGLHAAAGWAYQLSVLVLSTTTVALVLADPGLWPFLLITAATQAAALAGAVVGRRRRPGWLPMHVRLSLGSLVSLVTAFCVNTVGGVAGWLVPSVVGSVLVAAATARAARHQEPAADSSATAVPA